jgi:hypothetical protein
MAAVISSRLLGCVSTEGKKGEDDLAPWGKKSINL